jgi:hypothetical protein
MDNFEDMILPDDFVLPQTNTEGTESSNDSTTNTNENVGNEGNSESTTTNTESTTTQNSNVNESNTTTEPQKIKIKYNHEEKEISIDEARELAQKGMAFDKSVERAKQEARDSYIAEQNFVWNNKPIKTEVEYKQALAEQELIQKYQNQNLPDDVIQELIESKKFREESKELQKIKSDEEAKKTDYVNFINWFEETNGRSFDANKDQIPQEVWNLNSNGKSLVDAYASHENKILRDKLKQLEHNQSIATKAPVKGVTTNGNTNVQSEEDDPYLKGFDSI